MIKGEAIIELTDVKTGDVEVLRESNLVTTAMSDVLNGTIWFIDRFWSTTKDKNYPLYNHLLGGIVLFPERLEENPEKYWAPYYLEPTGFASNVVNSGTETRRGSFNVNESMPVINDAGEKIGYKYVWDFNTSQGNGTITSVCLTHPQAGYNWYGCMDSETNKRLVSYIEGAQGMAAANVTGNWYYFTRCFFADRETGYAYSWNNAGKIIKTRLTPYPSLSIVESPPYVENNPDNLFTDAFDISGTAFWTANTSRKFLQLSDHEMLGVTTAGSISSPTTVKWIKINIRTAEITEGSWNISVPLGRAEGMVTYSNGYLFWVAYDKKSVYRINLSNIVDITQYLYESGAISAGDAYSSLITAPSGVVLGPDFYISDRLIQTVKFGDFQGNQLNYIGGFINGCYLYNWYYSYWSGSGYYDRFNVALFPQYLATINNLSSPVTKTADKTMKITYTITETE